MQNYITRNTMQCNTMQYHTIPYNTMQHYIIGEIYFLVRDLFENLLGGEEEDKWEEVEEDRKKEKKPTVWPVPRYSMRTFLDQFSLVEISLCWTHVKCPQETIHCKDVPLEFQNSGVEQFP